MKRFSMAILGLALGGVVQAAEVEATTAAFRLSIKHDGIRQTTGDETLTYSSLWDGDAGATVTIAQDGVAIAEGLTGEDAYAWSVTRNGTYVLAHATYTNGVAGAVETATFVVAGLAEPFADGDVKVSGYSGKYDGAAHGITVGSEIAGVAYKYASGSAGATGPTGEWSNVVPTLTDVGTMAVWVEISAPGYITETNSATVTISKREVTLTSGSGSKTYDGTALVKHEVAVSGDGFVANEGASYEYTGSQTDVGSSGNAFDYTLNANTKAGNYAIATVNGMLTVTKASAGGGVTGGDDEPGSGYVPTGGESKFDSTAMYDGEGHTIETNALMAAFRAAMIGESAVEYAKDGGLGEAALPWGTVPVYTNVGEYVVWYRVSNPNYEDFIHAAKVTITNRPVTVTSADGSWKYDGQAHSNATVTAEGFVDGEGIVAGGFAEIVDVGTTANAFGYTFADGTLAGNYLVTCVTGTLTVAAADMGGWMDDAKWSVTLSGDGAKYDGTEKTCEVTAVAYDGFAIPTFAVSGNTATDAGDYTLTVTGTGNFSGSHTFPWSIAKREVTLTSGSASKVYDGTELVRHDVTVSGDGFAAGDGAVYTYLGAQTNVGQCDNSFVYTLNAGTKASNYTMTTVNGTLTITRATNAWTTEPSIAGWTYGQAPNAPNMGAAKFGTVAVSYSSAPQSAGTYTATFTVAGTDNYTGLSKPVQFTIAKATYDMSGARWSGSSFTYDGTEKSVIVEGLPAGVSVASYAGNAKTAAGSYTASVVLDYNATNYNAPSMADCSWSIARKSIAGGTVTLGPALVYTGSPQTQTVTGVKVDGLNATYTVSGNTATDTGDYTLTVTGTGNFTGSETAQWRIHPDGIVDQVTSYDGIYDGGGHGIEVVVTKPDGAAVKYALAENGPYAAGDVLFTNVTDGAAAVWYTVEAANYTTVTNFGTVKISPKTLTDAMVSVADTAYTYDGTAKTPTVTVSDGNPSILVEDDYDIAYSGNVNAGEATVTVTGKGNYTGTVTRHFDIAKAEVTPLASVASKAYTGGLLKSGLLATERYTVTDNGGVDAGGYPVTLTLTDATNYRWAGGDSNPLNLTFTITKATNAWTTQPSIAGWTYGQAPNVPNMGAAKFGTVAVSYSSTPQGAGSYTATFTVVGTDNYTGLSKSVQFAIAKATYDMSSAYWGASSFTYDGNPHAVTLNGLPLGVSAAYSGNTATVAGNYTAHATFSYDAANFNAPSMVDCSWSIARKSIAGATVTLGPTLVYNGSPQTQAVTGVKVDGLNATYTVSGNTATDAGGYTLTVTGTGNFTGSETAQWRIHPDGIVDQVTSYDGIYDGGGHGIEVVVTKPDGAVVKYALAENGPYAAGGVLFTNVTDGAAAVWYTVEAANYTTVTNFGTVKISPKTLTDAMVTVADSAYVYDGTAKYPTVTVADGEPSILTTEDYEVAYSGNVNAGEATVTVTGKGNYTGTVTKHFDIAKAEVTPPASVASKAYTGEALKADVSATERYTVSNDGGVNVGSYPVTLTLTDATNYRWAGGDSNPRNLTFTITKATNAWTTQPSIAGWTYGQAPNAPNMGAAKFGTATVSYSPTLQNAGTYTATFTVAGTANYTGLSKSVQFAIAKATYDMSGARWSGSSFTYDGTEKSVIVEGLPAGVSVSSYANNAKTAAGNYTASVVLDYNATNYNAPSMADCSWSIARKSIAGATVTLGPALVYNGMEQTQTVTGVKIDGLNATYTISGNKGTEAGHYILTVTGTGNFTGTTTKQWQIRPDGIVESVISYDGIYDGEGHGIEVSVTKPVEAMVKYAYAANGPYEPDAILFTNVTEGTIAIWYTVEAENYASVTNFGTVKISPKTLADAMVTVSDISYTYDGVAKTPTVTVADGDPSILAEDDYEVAYSDNINAGADTATITVTGKGNYMGTVTKHFAIAKAEVDPPMVAGKTYTGGLLKADVSSTTRYTVVNDGGVKVGKYPVTLTLTDAANYRWKGSDSNPLNLTFTITKAPNSWLTQPSISGWTYGQAPNAPSMGSAKFGNVQVTYSATPVNAGGYTATFTVPETANYAGLTKAVPFSIAKAMYDMSGAKWDYSGAFSYDGGVKMVGVSGLPLGVAVADYSGNSAVVPGTYTAHVVFSYDSANFNAPELADLVWQIKSRDQERLEDIFDGLPATVEPDGSGGWTVTLTDDIDSADLPIEIPDNLGAVTIDLNGHDLVGANGADGDETTPGENGKPAIRIVPGSGDGDATELKLTSTGDDALVKGGDGGNGTPGGNGASAIEVAVGAQSGVKVDVGAGVTVQGGAGGDSTTGKGGDGGAGVDGNVGTNDGAIVGGDGGASVTGDGGNGGPGVDGGVDVNNGSITGGDGGHSEHGRGGDGGMGVTGSVGTNDGTIAGGSAGGTADGTPGDDGLAVGGTIGGGTGTIAKAQVLPPTLVARPYTGALQTAAVPESPLYSVVRNEGGVDAGDYSVTLALADTVNYRWKDGDSAPLTLVFSIVQAPNAWLAEPFIVGWTYGQAASLPNMGAAKFGDAAVSYSAVPWDPGDYTATFTVTETANYTGLSKSVKFTIASVEEGKLRKIFDGLPATVEPDGSGGWTVTLMDDIDSADLPLEIPDNLGHVTIDLNGHDLVGADGADGDDSTPGGDGRPAILIVPGDGGGDATRLSLVSTGEDSLVKGGDGGAGNPGGGGAPAIEVSTGCRGGVGIDIGAGVTVQGGRGGAPIGEGAEPGADAPAVVGGDVTVTGGTYVKVQVPVPEVSPAEYTGEEQSPAVPASGLYVVSTPSATRPGSYPVTFTLLDAANYEWTPREGAVVNGAVAVVDFVIVSPPPRIETEGGGRQGRENGASTVAVYDGAGHGISVKVAYPLSGATVRYARTAAGPFEGEIPLFTNVVDGAETWYEVSAAGFDPVTNMAAVTVSPRSLANAELGAIRFEAVGGVRTPVPTLVDDLGHEVAPGNYSFAWTEEASGAMTLTFTGRENYLGLFEKRLAQTRFHVVFDANGGEVDVEGADYDIGTYYGILPVPFRAGYLFDGWYEDAGFAPDSLVTRNTEVIAQDLELYAKWLRRRLWYDDAVFHLSAAATWDGYMIDPEAGDAVAGTVKVKVGKPNRKTELCSVKVTLQVAGERAVKLKGTTFDGTLRATAPDGRELDLRLGAGGLDGTFGRYALDGSRNVFQSKDEDSKLAAAQALKRWQGTYVAAWPGDGGWNGMSLVVGTKGKTKVSGILADGAKVSASTQLLVGERECAVAVSWTKKSASVACLLWFREDGSVECANLPGGASALVANARAGSSLVDGAVFRVDADGLLRLLPDAVPELLPDGLAVRMKGTKFDVDKVGKVGLAKDKTTLDLSKAGTNPSALKLSYTAKSATFKGSFTVYTLGGGKLKKVKVSVSGVVLGGRGYGTATVKKVGSVPIYIGSAELDN